MCQAISIRGLKSVDKNLQSSNKKKLNKIANPKRGKTEKH